MWRLPDDDTAPVITAREHIRSGHRPCGLRLPGTAVVFFMGKGPALLAEKYPSEEQPEPFPSFVNRRPVWIMKDRPVCFLNGGGGAPQAADTVETLAALGVDTIIAVGMFGSFSPSIRPGGIVVPEKAFVEEGTSLHYYESIDSAAPDPELHEALMSLMNEKPFPIVSTDAVYRQTFRKEEVWRGKGAVGVDMETSALFSVSRYLGIRAAAVLMASDLHPLDPGMPKWEWLMTDDMRRELTERCGRAAREIAVS